MTSTSIDALRLTVMGSGDTLELNSPRTIIAGYTGRDEDAVREHIDELAAIGVTPPPQVPMFYTVEPASVTTHRELPVPGPHTSGELEPVMIRHDNQWFLGIGSDHTDRNLETVDIGDSKRACPKPVGTTVVAIDDWRTFDWDHCHAHALVDGQDYQDGSLAGLRLPHELLTTLEENLGDDGNDLIVFAGTIPLLSGTFVYGTTWEFTLTLPDGTALTHTYITTASTEEK